MGWISRNSHEWVSKSSIGITLWGLVRYFQGDSLADDVEFLQDTKADIIRPDAENWPGANAKNDGGGMYVAIDYHTDMGGAPRRILPLTGWGDLGIDNGLGSADLTDRWVWMIGNVTFHAASNTFMPDHATYPHHMNTQWDLTAINQESGAGGGATADDHWHGVPVDIVPNVPSAAESATFSFSGGFYTHEGQSAYSSGDDRMFFTLKPPGAATNTDYTLSFYYDSDDDLLKVYWNSSGAAKGLGWALCIFVSPKLDS